MTDVADEWGCLCCHLLNVGWCKQFLKLLRLLQSVPYHVFVLVHTQLFSWNCMCICNGNLHSIDMIIASLHLRCHMSAYENPKLTSKIFSMPKVPLRVIASNLNVWSQSQYLLAVCMQSLKYCTFAHMHTAVSFFV